MGRALVSGTGGNNLIALVTRKVHREALGSLLSTLPRRALQQSSPELQRF